jgi:hypothetical protein
VVSLRVLGLFVLGAALVLLGVLWVLQGADLVHVRPVLCVTDCKPVTGGSFGWLLAGVVTGLFGLFALAAARRQVHRTEHP